MKNISDAHLFTKAELAVLDEDELDLLLQLRKHKQQKGDF